MCVHVLVFVLHNMLWVSLQLQTLNAVIRYVRMYIHEQWWAYQAIWKREGQNWVILSLYDFVPLKLLQNTKSVGIMSSFTVVG